jgi:hypothetical protein
MVKMETDLLHLTTPVATVKSQAIHLQKVCRSTESQVDDKGKPYAKYVHEVEQEDEQQQQQQYHEQGSIAAAFNPWAYYNPASNM